MIDDLRRPDRTSLSFLHFDAPSRAVRADLEQLTHLVDSTLRHARTVLETQRRGDRIDGHRDALHLVARIEGLSRQLEHAAEPLRRIEAREAPPRCARRSA